MKKELPISQAQIDTLSRIALQCIREHKKDPEWVKRCEAWKKEQEKEKSASLG